MSTSKQGPAGAAASGARATAAREAAGHPAHPEGLAHLIKMANDIGHFFRAEERHEDAVAGIANHVNKYWTPRMREKVLTYLKGPADAALPALEALPHEAFTRVVVRPDGKPSLPHGSDPGGDAG